VKFVCRTEPLSWSEELAEVKKALVQCDVAPTRDILIGVLLYVCGEIKTVLTTE
jgi:hypothetical protein